MNITLSAPEETVHAVRVWAARNNTSLNQFIRDSLEEKARELQAEVAARQPRCLVPDFRDFGFSPE